MGVRAVFDTNVLIDHLNGVTEARTELSRYRERLASVVTWTEVMVGTTPEKEGAVRRFLNNFQVVGLGSEVAALGVSLGREQRLKLPAAIIYATARSAGCVLVTRNSKDFSPELADVRIPYRL